ncbi:MAG: hypothetical protein JNK67_25835 [Alphaproteobacteria bacterium]|nr:hypothetical protein [Alphaproteobacteria bacterium]
MADGAPARGAMKAGLVYFAIVFAVGAALGPLRELVLAPRLGELGALLVEAPAMLAATFLTAGWLVRRFALADRKAAALGAGLVAFAALSAVELLGAIALRGLAPSAYLARFATTPGLISLTLFVLFALMPAIRAHRRDR